MRAKGIGYDAGFVMNGQTRPFDREIVRRELEIIRDDLHCNAVRVFGSDLDRLEYAAGCAADLGMEVWFSPFTAELEQAEMLALLADAATRAERLRGKGANVVFVTGAELSLFNRGFLLGNTFRERTDRLVRRDPEALAQVRQVPAAMNAFLALAVAMVRARFGGPVTYASIPYEGVDWTRFDIVGVDLHRSREIAEIYPQAVRTLVAQGKPVAITEFGCTAYRGAADRGASSGDIVELDGAVAVRLNGDYVRDEEEQATYLRELLDIYEEAGVDAAFACTFVCYGLVHRTEPRLDLDMASWGVVKILDEGAAAATYPGMPWEPKAAFRTLAQRYGP